MCCLNTTFRTIFIFLSFSFPFGFKSRLKYSPLWLINDGGWLRYSRVDRFKYLPYDPHNAEPNQHNIYIQNKIRLYLPPFPQYGNGMHIKSLSFLYVFSFVPYILCLDFIHKKSTST